MEVKSVTVNYPNFSISGFYSKIEFGDILKPTVILCRHSTPINESPYHYLDYDGAISIEVEYITGEILRFN
jgi:hypothetical protein